MFQPDCVCTQGISGLRPLADDVVAAGKSFTPHTWGNGIGLIANAHLTAGTVGAPFLEFPFDPPEWSTARRDYVLTETIEVDGDGWITLSDRPGLGCTLHEAALAVDGQQRRHVLLAIILERSLIRKALIMPARLVLGVWDQAVEVVAESAHVLGRREHEVQLAKVQGGPFGAEDRQRSRRSASKPVVEEPAKRRVQLVDELDHAVELFGSGPRRAEAAPHPFAPCETDVIDCVEEQHSMSVSGCRAHVRRAALVAIVGRR